MSEANDLFRSKAVELGNFFLMNKLYLPEIAAQKIDQLLRDCNYNVWSYRFSVHRQGVFSTSGHADLMQKAFADEDSSRNFLENELPLVIGMIENEFKNVLQIK